MLVCSPNIERRPMMGPAKGIENGFVDNYCLTDVTVGAAFSLIFPEPILAINDEGYFEGVFDSLPVAN